MIRFKTYDATGIAPSGKLYAGDLNAIQDAAAALTDLTQNLSVGTVAIGEAGLQLVRYAAGEARLVGALRSDGIFRGMGGLFAGSFSTVARDALVLGTRPYGLVVTNTTTNRLEWNSGSDAAPSWVPVGADGSGSLVLPSLLRSDQLVVAHTANSIIYSIGVNPAFAVAGSRVLSYSIGAEAQPRLMIDVNGVFSWGPGGSTPPDANLYRLAANTLKSDSKVIVSGLGIIGIQAAAGVVLPNPAPRRIELFDAAGVSNGFIPVYNNV